MQRRKNDNDKIDSRNGTADHGYPGAIEVIRPDDNRNDHNVQKDQNVNEITVKNPLAGIEYEITAVNNDKRECGGLYAEYF